MSSASDNVTQLLVAWSDGDPIALDQLMPLVQRELHRIANNHFRRERPGHTLQATALVNEVYLRLIDQREVDWQNRAHFFAIAAKLMRRILVDHARARQVAKRGGGALQISFDEGAILSLERSAEIVALDDALANLAAIDGRKSQVVELRFFGGLSVEETAKALNISPNTVIRDWSTAKAWLHRELRMEESRDE
jgi:RNA polymerase sigma factor (TIGR02999 family)